MNDILVNNGLWGDGLIKVNTPEMVRRYNACLTDMGLEPTNLDSFGIDATGWSPEVAGEKNNQYYLSHGEANQLMIVLFPEQRNCPIWSPFHSFDWDLAKQLYDNHKPQIFELTQRDGVWFDVDQEIDTYHGQKDLLFIDHILVRANTPTRLMSEAGNQRKLIREFMDEHDTFLAEAEALINIPTQLTTSRKNFGDIGHKPMVIRDMAFTVPRSFYSHAFGGTFVLRSQKNGKELLISKSDTVAAEGVTKPVDQKILRNLSNLGMIGQSPEFWLDKLPGLKVIRDSFLMGVLDDIYPELDYVSLPRTKQKSILAQDKVLQNLPEEYTMLDRIIKSLERDKIPKRIPTKVSAYLAHPLDNLDSPIKEVVWYVLSLVCDGRSVVRFYRYDKERFFTVFKSWKTPRQSWAIDCIKKYYEHRMMKR